MLDTLAVLGSSSDTVWPLPVSYAVRGRDGNFHVGPTDHPGALVTYSSNGKLLRTFGRSGEGPGEYSSILLKPVRGPADTISVVDVMARRRTLLDDVGEPIRSHAIPYQFHSMATVNGRLIVQADIRTPDKIGWLLHEISADGALVTSYVENPVYRGLVDGIRPMTGAVEGGIWLALPTRYELQYYDTTLTLIRTLYPQAEWFPPTGSGTSGHPRLERPDPRIQGIGQTPDSLLWVLIRVAPEEWKPSEPDTARGVSVSTWARDFDWLLEVIDPQTGERIASQRHDGLFWFGMGDGLLYEKSEGQDGRVFLTAFRPTLAERRTSQ